MAAIATAVTLKFSDFSITFLTSNGPNLLLLSYSDASNEFGPLEVKNVIEKSENFKVTAVAIAAIKCPQHIVK